MAAKAFWKIIYTNWTAKESIALARLTENLETWIHQPPPDLEMVQGERG